MRRKPIALLSLGHAVTDLVQGGLTMLLAFLQPTLGLGQLQVGMVMLAFNVSSSVIQPAFGVFSDRFHAAWLIPSGCLLAGVGMAAAGYMPDYPLLMLAAFISGIGVAAYHPEASKFARQASGKRKASGMSLFSVGGNFGFALGPILATGFLALAGRNGTMGFLLLNGLMALVLWRKLPAITATPAHVAGTQQPPRPKTRFTWAVVYPVVILVLLIIMRTWTHFGIVTFLPQYYIHHLDYSKEHAAALTSLFLFAGAWGTLAGGPAADRWGLKPLIVASLVVMIPLLYLFPRTSGVPGLIVIALAGFALIATFATTVVLGQELLPNNVGLASGLTLGFGVGTGGIGATLLGAVADRWGLPMIFNWMIGFTLVGLLLALMLPGSAALAARREHARY
ncbi:MAG TPA: MFS transporter [Kiritimatiellia bacterium]|jgi:FSR family fosmidomycin resistance protein-like MFS transporter|nr:MAG: Fosmidomycin resistance protein [Verrucomicrobia bacterium ADurb.Bin018]HOD99426.1 MFS transporter [Kiritimatiellia bacterium]HOE36087.1 MFS transporter [Kiritimatiellia bacterium]HOR73511.1 MFS transporter [Kiritimatiellia bacterium]HOU58099.1 MFS transporter [Kiritimatiellia bacterium]